MNYKTVTIVYIFIYYQLMIIKRELVSQNEHKAHLNYMKHDVYYSTTRRSTYQIQVLMEYYVIKKYTKMD